MLNWLTYFSLGEKEEEVCVVFCGGNVSLAAKPSFAKGLEWEQMEK